MPDKLIIIDRRGDLRVRVGPDQHADECIEFLVCSRSLARASLVFDRMLYGSFSDSIHNQPNNASSNKSPWTVRLVEEKPVPFEIFLNITHANVSKVPHILSVDSLYDLAVLTDYYDATTLLIPWIEGWVASVKEVTRDANTIMPKMLWISWEFGRQTEFMTIARRLLMETKTPWPTESFEVDGVLAPPYIVERINAVRLQTIHDLLDVVYKVVEVLTVVDEGPRWCRYANSPGHHRCESMLLGSMTFCLARAGLWPLPVAEDVKLSLLEIYHIMTSLIIHDIGETSEKPREDHQECNPGPKILRKVQQVMSAIPSLLTEYHISRLDKQAEKLQPGVFNPIK
ncbi:hypothetical protein QQS21_006784 [Conoideocrella luteorostrata]|uniref:Nuclear pore protein n=1 Tax=Conoideocrella luteorostrata TaxID=1105319 RepID=A0AAJ0CM46_9HYPO|nr:hypothetical protein QQS21_006784 [Conoideocrella luteorostrata]